MLELGILQYVLEIINDVRGVEVDLQVLKLDAMDGDGKEAGDGCGAGVFRTHVPEEKRLELSQGRSEFDDVVVVQLEGALALVVFLIVIAVDPYGQRDQVSETLNRGDERSINNNTGGARDAQGL